MYTFQVGRTPRHLRCHIDAVLDVSGIDEVWLQMREALEEYCFVSQPDVVEQNEVLVNLSHVTHVGNDPQTELSRQKAHRKEL